MAQEHTEYLLARREQEMAAAAVASSKAARVAHSELAFRYSLAVAHAGAEICVSGRSTEIDQPQAM